MNNQTLWNKKKTAQALKVIGDSLTKIAKLHEDTNMATAIQAELIRIASVNMINAIFAEPQYYNAAAKTVSVSQYNGPD